MFPQILKKLREERGYTQEYVGKYAHVSSKTVGAWERGTRQPSIEAVTSLSALFDVTTDYLLGNATSKHGKAPKWANDQDKKDLKQFLEDNENSYTYGGDSLTDDEREQVRHVLEGIFWKHQKHE